MRKNFDLIHLSVKKTIQEEFSPHILYRISFMLQAPGTNAYDVIGFFRLSVMLKCTACLDEFAYKVIVDFNKQNFFYYDLLTD